MKNLSFLVLTVALAIGVVSCGNKDKDSGSSSSNGYSSRVAYLDLRNPIAIIDNQNYQISQQSFPVMSQAFQIAQQQNIQPVMINGNQMFKANITYLPIGSQQYQGGMQGGYPQGGNQLTVTQAVIIP